MDWFKHENCYVHINSFCDINLWFPKFNTTTDILYGRNQSCRALKKNFNVPNGVYYIHPWRDERKIKVDCFGKILIDWLIEFFSITYGWTMSLCILSIVTYFFKIYRKTEKHYLSIFFTRLWSVRKLLLFDTHNPKISGFLTAQAYKYKTKWQSKMRRRQKKVVD